MKRISAKTKICMVIGDPIAHSLSPQMHNAGYAALDIDDQFVYVACRVAVKSIRHFVGGVRAMGIRGVSCTVPHKEKILPYLDRVDEVAKKIGAVNTIVNNNSELTGLNTDWLGAVKSLEVVTSLNGRKVAVIGAGGAARAIVYGLTIHGAEVSVFNRTFSKAEKLAKEFGVKAECMEELIRVQEAEVVINTAKIGLEDDKSPIPPAFFCPGQVVFDTVYKPGGTRLFREAAAEGVTVISGQEMLLWQGVEQFSLYTDRPAPVDAMRKALSKHLA